MLRRKRLESEYVSTQPEISEQFRDNLEVLIRRSVSVLLFILVLIALFAMVFGLNEVVGLDFFIDVASGFVEFLVIPLFFGAYVVEEGLANTKLFKRGVASLSSALWFVVKRFRREIRLQHSEITEDVPVDLDIDRSTGLAHWAMRAEEAREVHTTTSWEPFEKERARAARDSGSLELAPGRAAINLTRTSDNKPQLELRSTDNAGVRMAIDLDAHRWVPSERLGALPELERFGALTLPLPDQQELVGALAEVADATGVRLPQELRNAHERSAEVRAPAVVVAR